MRVTEKNGRVLAVLEVGDDDGIIIASDGGNVMRTSVSEFRVMGRVTMGVRAKRLEEGEKVIAVQRLVGEKDREAVAEAEVKEDGSILPVEDKDNGNDRPKDQCENGDK
jgi:DNA gyrase subunit A